MGLLEIIVLAMAIPAGYLLAWLCKDELADGKKWFYWIVIFGVFLGGWGILIDEKIAGYTCLFIAIAGFISLMKSKDKKWIGKRKV